METDNAQGWASIPRWLLYSSRFTAHAKLVYVVVQSHTDATGSSFPSHARIAEEAGLSVSAVQRALTALAAVGLVEIEPRRRRDGGKTSNIYRVSATLPPVDKPGDNGHPSVTQTDGASVTQTDQ